MDRAGNTGFLINILGTALALTRWCRIAGFLQRHQKQRLQHRAVAILDRGGVAGRRCQIGSQYLDVLRFFLNHPPFRRNQQPRRVGKTPAELLTGQAHPHWLMLKRLARAG